MHKITKENLETLARWTEDVVRGDRHLTAIQANMPEEVAGRPHSVLSSSFTSISLNLYQAEQVSDIGPYMRAIRFAGFKREQKQEYPENSSIVWTYKAKDGYTVLVTLWLKLSEEAQCRYVETGKKEVPVMKLMCGDELKEWDDTHEVVA